MSLLWKRCFWWLTELWKWLVSSITVGKVYLYRTYTEMCWGISQFFKNKFIYDIKSLSQHFDKETYQFINITWLLLTGKRLCRSLFLILSIAKFLRLAILKNSYFELYIIKQVFFSINNRNKLMIGISWLFSYEVCIHIHYFFGVLRNKLQTKEDQKFRKKICHMNML